MNRRNFLKSIAAALAALPFVQPKPIEEWHKGGVVESGIPLLSEDGEVLIPGRGKRILAIGDDHSIIVSDNGGGTWTQVESGSIRPTFQPHQVTFTEAGNYEMVITVWDNEGVASWDVIKGTVTR